MVRRAEVIEAEEQAALSQVARQRSQTYWWLSELYLEAPDHSGITRLVDRAREALASSGDVPLYDQLRDLAAALQHADVGALAVEHARLFAGMGASYGAIPPYESMQQASSEPREDCVTNVTAAYREAGFGRIDVPAVPQDHLAVELRFMALLAANESEAWTLAATDEARAMVLRERSFLGEHLLSWAPAYCERMASEAREPFFTALARITSAALVLDRQDLGEVLRMAASS